MRARNRIFVYYLCGVFAAAQLGKLAALAPLISRDLHLGLAAMAGLTSLLEVCGALLGGAAGRHLPRFGLQRGLAVAMVCLAVGAAGAAVAHDMPMAAAARLVESLGYLVTVVAAPVLIAAAAPPQRQAAAMTLWSTFVPVGMAIGASAYAYAAGLSDWRWAQGLSVLAGLALGGCLLGMPPAHGTGSPGRSPAGPSVKQRTGAALWTLVAAFGAYVVAEVGLLALLPSLLEEAGMSLSEAGLWTALAALANVPASILGAWLMKRHAAFVGRAMVLSLLLSGALFPLAYRLGAPPMQLAVMAILVNLISGVFASLTFALLPRVAGSPEHLSLASGRLTQFGASGALLGPPLIGSVVERGGWHAAGWVSVVLSVVAASLASRVGARPPSAGKSLAP